MPAGRRHHDRRVHPRAQQRDAGVDVDDVAQHARAQLQLAPGDDILLRGDLVVGAGVAEHPGLRPHHPPRLLLQRIEVDAILQHHSNSLPVINAGHTTDHRNALSRRGPPWQAWRSHCREFSMAASRPSTADKRTHLPQAARERLLRHSESVERRQRALSAGTWLQGHRLDQLRPRAFAGLSRRRAIAGRGARALPRAGRRNRHSAQRRFRGRLRQDDPTRSPRT